MLTVVLLALLFEQPLLPPAILHGRVVDPSGSAVPDATVLFDLEGKVPKALTTQSDGAFEITLVPGTYELRIQAAGFEVLRQEVALVPGANRGEFTLRIGTRSE